MGRGPVHPVETKLKIVLSVLSGECSQAEAARRHGISETSIGKWREQFVTGGKAGLQAGGAASKPTGREAQLAAELDELTRALGEAHVGRGQATRRLGGRRGLRISCRRRGRSFSSGAESDPGLGRAEKASISVRRRPTATRSPAALACSRRARSPRNALPPIARRSRWDSGYR